MRIFPLLGWMLFPGCWAAVQVWGPRTVQGPLGGSVTVRCRYELGDKTYRKYWCRVGEVPWFCPKGHLATSDGTEAEAKWGRVSIRDNQTQRVFTVTTESLTRADNGTYRCGLERAAALWDLRDTVTVLVSPDDPSPSPTGRTPSTPEQPESPSPPPSTATLTSAEEGESSSRTNQDTTGNGSQLSNVHFFLLALWKVPIFLCILGANVWYTKNSGRGQTDMMGASTRHTLRSYL